MAFIEDTKDRSIFVATLATEIANLTDTNHHTDAVILLASSLPGVDDLRDELIAIGKNHRRVGHMQHVPYHRREEICRKLLVLAKIHFNSPGHYDQIYAAF